MTTNEYIRGVKKYAWAAFPGKLWQRNYWEHIVRNDDELEQIRNYIDNNPQNWVNDKLNGGVGNKEQDVLVSNVLEDFTGEIIDPYHALKKEKESFVELGIDFEEKAFYDILKTLMLKYDFEYPEDKLLHLAKEVKKVVDDKAKDTDWSQRDDIKAELKADLIILLAENDHPPVQG